MVTYQCPRCGYTNNIKTKYINHLKRKNICQPLLTDSDLEDEYTKYNLKNFNNNINNNINSDPNPITVIPKTEIKHQVFICNICKKQYKYSQSLSRHKNKCISTLSEDKDKNTMMELVNVLNNRLSEAHKELYLRDKQLKKKENEIDKKDKHLDKLISKTGFSANIVNIQNNFKLLGYRKTDISHLTENDFVTCMSHKNLCIPHLIKKIHFNPAKPENHNIYISNIKNNYVMLYDGIKWNLRNRDETIINLIDDKESIVEQKLEEWVENGKGYPNIMKQFNKYLEKRENDEVLNTIKEEIKLILFNNRNLVSVK